ncbi:MAG TPA: hypothetical protein VKT49_14660 [Bryobacteraceae bacterium]|nr:hypothetical protein [Bryobacteraceae bacterium]
MLIKYASGIVQEGMLISLRGSRLRVAAKDSDDVLEFNLVDGTWLSEHCEPVTFDLTLGLLESIGFMRGVHEVIPSAALTNYVN